MIDGGQDTTHNGVISTPQWLHTVVLPHLVMHGVGPTFGSVMNMPTVSELVENANDNNGRQGLVSKADSLDTEIENERNIADTPNSLGQLGSGHAGVNPCKRHSDSAVCRHQVLHDGGGGPILPDGSGNPVSACDLVPPLAHQPTGPINDNRAETAPTAVTRPVSNHPQFSATQRMAPLFRYQITRQANDAAEIRQAVGMPPFPSHPIPLNPALSRYQFISYVTGPWALS